MLGKGIEAALMNPSTLVPEPWQASSEMLQGIDPDAMTVHPSLVGNIQVCFILRFAIFSFFSYSKFHRLRILVLGIRWYLALNLSLVEPD